MCVYRKIMTLNKFTNQILQVYVMEIIEIKENKKDYLDLLLLADEEEDMIDRYLDNGKKIGRASCRERV